ncbi:MAG: hypothetical protein KIT58_04145 [Planctomycetota bacterium]|nr:hypothetical protein [Planctomycetota bacterium]
MAKKKAAQKKPAPHMRVQLQRGLYETFDSEPLSPTKAHADQVVVAQVTAALRRMRDSAHLPKSRQKRADGALAAAIEWVENRPPDGRTGRYGQSFPFDEEEPKSDFRFDVENLRGHNLRE